MPWGSLANRCSHHVGARVAPPLLRAVVERLSQCLRDGEHLVLLPKHGVVAACDATLRRCLRVRTPWHDL